MQSLREMRLEKLMTQTDVAVYVGCSLASYRMWELGVTKPSDKYKIKLIKLFGREHIDNIFN
jgi:DNA-binding XRE family transcriptional regulator